MASKESKKTYQVVIIRHGESSWNKENRFTGWHDVPLTEGGRTEATQAGLKLKEQGFVFDKCYTSVLKRAVHTLDIVLDQMGLTYLPVEKRWRLNERMYGGLTGMNKSECMEKFGNEQVVKWRRSVDSSPPNCELDSEYYPGNDPRYALVPKCLLPRTENLLNCIERVLPCWFDEICPDILSGKRLILAIHGNSTRALVKHLESLSDERMPGSPRNHRRRDSKRCTFGLHSR